MMDPLVLVSALFTIVLGLCGVIMTLIMFVFNHTRAQAAVAQSEAVAAKELATSVKHQADLHEVMTRNLAKTVDEIKSNSNESNKLISDINNKLIILLNDRNQKGARHGVQD